MGEIKIPEPADIPATADIVVIGGGIVGCATAFWASLAGLGAVLLWFIPWYLRRYFGVDWPVSSLSLTLVFGFSTAAVFIFLDWLWERLRKNSQPPAPETGTE